MSFSLTPSNIIIFRCPTLTNPSSVTGPPSVMPAVRKKKSTGSHVPTTSMNTRNTPASSINVVVPARNAAETTYMGTRNTSTLPALIPPTTSARTRNASAHPYPAPPFNHIIPRTPTLPNRYAAGIPLSVNAIPSDTTEWDPNMVSPTKMDSGYKPAAKSAVPTHNLRSGWTSSPPVHPNQQNPTARQNGGNSSGPFWTTVGAPEIGMFPTMPPGSNSQMTQLHPIPLDFSRFAGSEKTARSTNIYHTGAALGRGHSPLGRDIPLPLFTPNPMRRTTRSSTLLQPPKSLQQPVRPPPAGGTLAPVHQNAQVVDSQDLVAQQMLITETEARDQQMKFRKARLFRERHQAGAMERKERRQGMMGAAGQSSPSVQYMTPSNSPGKLPDSKSPARIPASLQAAIDQIPRYLGQEQISENPQAAVNHRPAYLERITVNPHTTIDHAPKYLQRATLHPQAPRCSEQVAVNPPAILTKPVLVQKNTSTNDRSLRSPTQPPLATVDQPGGQAEPAQGIKNPEDTNGNLPVAASQIPRYLERTAVDPRAIINHTTENPERVVRDPPVAINHPVPVSKIINPPSWMTPEISSSPRLPLNFPILQDPSDPSFGTTRPGAESPSHFDDVDSSWVFMQTRRPPEVERSPTMYGSTPEPDTPLTSPTGSEDIVMRDAEFKKERISGSTPTSYSQCPGSPTSLINMYRVHGDLNIAKPRGLSLLHTKRTYIGEKVLLDLDMPGWGDDCVMGMEEMEQLMDEMMDGEPGAEISLASVNKDRETGGRCLDSMSYVEWR